MQKTTLAMIPIGLLLFLTMAVQASPKEKTLSVGKADQYRVLTPAQRDISVQQFNQEKKGNGLEFVHFKAPQKSNDPELRSSSSASTLWTLDHTDGVAEYYLGSSGAAGDTFAIVFAPSAPCSVKFVETSWYTAGNYTAFAAKYSEEAKAISPDGEAGTIPRGSFDGSPIGDLLAPYTPGSVSDYGMYQRMPDDIGGFQVGSETELTAEPFLIGFVKGGEQPHPLADGDQAPITYTWFGGPWTGGQWGRYSDAVDINMAVYVTYPWGAPIAFSVDQLPNTYNTSGPFTVRFRLLDDDDNGTAISSDDNITLYASDSISTISVPFSAFTANDVESNGNGWYTAEITGLPFTVGDEISYWLEATDNQGYTSESKVRSFTVKQPEHPNADLLVIMDGGADRAAPYLHALDENGLVYDTWNADLGAENGIDASVINYGWNNIILFGWGASTIPATDEEDPGYATFLDNSGNLFFSDMDYFYAHGLPATGTFQPGDFAYDYFSLGDYTNDPVDASNDPIGDSLFTGLAGVASSISEYSLEGGLGIWDLVGSNWSDYVSASQGATELFVGLNDGENYGVQTTTDGGGTTIYLSFTAGAAVDTTVDGEVVPKDEFTALMNAVLDEFDLDSTSVMPIIKLTVDSVDTAPGDVVSVPIYVDFPTDSSYQSAEVSLTGYQSGLVFSGIDTSNTLPGEAGWSFVANENDGLFISWSAGTEPISGSGVLARLEFNVTGESETFIPVSVESAVFDTGKDSVVTEDGGVWINAPFAYGDVDGNGQIQAYDASLILQHLAEMITLTGEDSVAADLTLDQSISSLDASLLMQYGVGLIDSLPYDTTEGQLLASGDLQLTDQSIEPGITLSIPLSINDTDNLFGIKGVFEYNPAHLEFTGVEWSGLADGAISQVQEENGTIIVAMAKVEALDQSGTLARLRFQVREDFNGGESSVTLSKLHLNENPVQTNVSTATLTTSTGIDRAGNIPDTYTLRQNHPNPFNPTTTIRYGLPEAAQVMLTVYDLMGRKVTTLADMEQQAGWYTVHWDGTNEEGQSVSAGMYLYRFETPAYQAMQKMIYLK
ncbi:MAG: T9SS type A sorting domain-containing protein [Candidatus Marinimicrobia bacterium]|nr:T9SS type A sorting domain-containing protein [Candidatus Neomarinimicrobiota bacterium]MCF7880201.1 T9SS type A sorting domain-containing protein [Candidatus Neomarinimicrobiota bacterium]